MEWLRGYSNAVKERKAGEPDFDESDFDDSVGGVMSGVTSKECLICMFVESHPSQSAREGWGTHCHAGAIGSDGGALSLLASLDGSGRQTITII